GLKTLGIGGVAGVNVERDLERLLGMLRQRQELAEFVGLEPEGSAAMRNRPERPPPARPGREPVRFRSRDDGPIVEHHRPPTGAPGDAAKRDRALRSANVLGNREVMIVPCEPSGRQAGCLPELCVAGVYVEKYLAAQRLHQLG